MVESKNKKLRQEELLIIKAGKVNWGLVAGSCVGGAIMGAAFGGPHGATGGCVIGAAKSLWDETTK